MNARHIINWVWNHPRVSHVLPGWERDQTERYLLRKLLDDDVKIVINKGTGTIVAVVVLSIHDDSKSIFVDFILTGDANGLIEIVRYWKDHYAEYSVQAKRKRGKMKTYVLANFSRFIISHEKELAI